MRSTAKEDAAPSYHIQKKGTSRGQKLALLTFNEESLQVAAVIAAIS